MSERRQIVDIERNGNITFGNNILRLEWEGDIYVHGKLVENDKEVVAAMRELINYIGNQGR